MQFIKHSASFLTSCVMCDNTGEPLLTNFQGTNKFPLPIHLTNTESHTYRHFDKLTLTKLIIHLMKIQFNLRPFDL